MTSKAKNFSTGSRRAAKFVSQSEEDVMFGGTLEHPAANTESEDGKDAATTTASPKPESASEKESYSIKAEAEPEQDAPEKSSAPSKRVRGRQLNLLVDDDLYYDLKAYVARRDTEWDNLSSMVRDVMHDFLKNKEA